MFFYLDHSLVGNTNVREARVVMLGGHRSAVEHRIHSLFCKSDKQPLLCSDVKTIEESEVQRSSQGQWHSEKEQAGFTSQATPSVTVDISHG